MENRRESESKRPRIDGEDMFPTVGQQAEEVEYINASDLRTTGAEDSQGRPVQEIDSLCMNCHKQGVTKLLMTYIPNFREVVLMSFACPHCGFKNSEIQSAAEIREQGQEVKLQIDTQEGIGRQIVKSEHATCIFPQLDVEIPAGPGRITTVEGLLSGMKEDLERDQPVRRHVDSGLYEQVEAVNQKLQDAVDGKSLPLQFVLNDPSGNSFVAHTEEEEAQNKYTERRYTRTPTQARQIGLTVTAEDDHRNESVAQKLENETLNHGGEFDENVPQELREEIQTFEGACPSCHEIVATHMKIVNIPHFKDVIIMSTVCHNCGFKSNEVKTGGAVPDKGRRVRLIVAEAEDLTRDILKSETCTLKFPELQLDLTQGTLGGRFTTIEGLLQQVYEQLEKKVLDSEPGQLGQDEERRWTAFLARLQSAIDGHVLPLTVEMEDPLAASYIQNVYAPDEDPNMVIEDYERTFEENEDLGLNDMRA